MSGSSLNTQLRDEKEKVDRLARMEKSGLSIRGYKKELIEAETKLLILRKKSIDDQILELQNLKKRMNFEFQKKYPKEVKSSAVKKENGKK